MQCMTNNPGWHHELCTCAHLVRWGHYLHCELIRASYNTAQYDIVSDCVTFMIVDTYCMLPRAKIC